MMKRIAMVLAGLGVCASGLTALPTQSATAADSSGVLLGAAVAASNAGAPLAKPKRRTLKVRITGLPSGAKPVGTLRGPGLRTTITRSRVKVRNARPGVYRLSLRPTVTRSAGYKIKRGATVLPERGKVKVRVGKKGAVLSASYGTVLAKNTVAAPARIIKVKGDKLDPKGIVVPDSNRYVKGGYITAAPSKALPYGLVAKILRVRGRGSKAELKLNSVSVGRVVPVLGDAAQAAARTTTSRMLRAAAGGKPPYWDIYSGAGKAVPCKLLLAAGGEGSGDIDFGLKNLELDELAWPGDGSSGFVAHLTGEYSVRSSVLAPGEALECALPAWSITKQGFIAVGPVPIPVYGSFGLKLKAAARNQGNTAISIAAGARFEAAINTADADPDVFSGSLDPFLETSGGLTLDASVNPEVTVGVGVRNLVGFKLEGSPELRIRSYPDGTCRGDGWLVGTFAWDAFIWKGKPWSERIALFANKEVGGCGPLPDPLVGEWASSTDSSFRIEPAGAGSFTSTVLESSRSDETCQPNPAGTTSTITGANGTYTWQYSWWNYSECRMLEQDTAAKLTLDPADPTSFRLCGRRRSGISSCETWERVN